MEPGRPTGKIVVILGPTSSGKSAVAIRLARKFDGEIISADSRQIYRKMDIGTGKVTKVEQKIVRHWLLDIVNPANDYNVTDFKRDAEAAIENILERGKLPIVCGGTGFWIKALVDNVVFPEVRPNTVLRNMLRNKTPSELFKQLKKLDPERAKNIDPKNKVRLIRAIEICKALGKVPNTKHQTPNTKYQFLQIGLDVEKDLLNNKIKKRLKERFQAGLIDEVKKFKKSGLSWKKIQSFGLGYFWIPLHLQNKLSSKEAEERVFLAEKDYAKRQMTWFRKDKRIVWLKNFQEIARSVKKFLK